MILNNPELSPEQAIEAIADRVGQLLKTQTRILLAIDGQSASGKTTAAEQLAERLDARVLHMDDFFLQPSLRTAERWQLRAETWYRAVLPGTCFALSRRRERHSERYDCHWTSFSAPSHSRRARYDCEGAYSLHPLLKPHYDLSVFFKIDPVLQRSRILARNGEEMLQMFLSRWIPMENRYFEAFSVEQTCDFVVSVR